MIKNQNVHYLALCENITLSNFHNKLCSMRSRKAKPLQSVHVLCFESYKLLLVLLKILLNIIIKNTFIKKYF